MKYPIQEMDTKVQGLGLLKLTFWMSLLGVLFSFILSYIFNRAIYFYNISYLLIIYLIVSVLIKNNKWSLYNASRNIYLLLLYSLIISLPLTIINGHFIAFLVFFKNSLLFALLFLYYQKRLNTKNKIVYFLHIIVKGGVFFAVYITLEFLNKILNIFPKFTQIINNYYQLNDDLAMAYYANSDKFDISSIIRPLGLELNFTAGSFFLSSIFFIVLISGHRFFKKKYSRISVIILLYISVFISTSRQIIFSMHILLFLLLLIKIIDKRIYVRSLLKSIFINIRIIFFFLISIFMGLYIYIINSIYIKYITEAGGQTGSIIIDDLNELFNNIYYMISEHTIFTLFGIGAYTPTYPGFYVNLPPPNELHYLYDIPYSMGLIGGGIYWSIFIVSILTSWRAFKISSGDSESFHDLYLVNVIIGLSLILCLVHYSPFGLSTVFIIALIPLLSIFAMRDIRKSKTFKKSINS